MKLVTPGCSADEVAEAQALYASVRRRLIELRDELEDLKERIAAGGEVDGTAAIKTLAQMNEVIGRCQKAELLVHECIHRQTGVARGGEAFDLERARTDIGCKLDRLRCSVGSGGFPE
ncbi:hypothetical protein ABMC89_02445 [Sulfitobacter sp. HNIBRBA3233]|uniref:hypothetical protein n=1 Tax=Sulfitobacter marinivivus TaxID=3158558 RepID=UPI0032DFA899